MEGIRYRRGCWRCVCGPIVVACLVAFAACGGGNGHDEPTVSQRVTRDFGTHLVGSVAGVPLEGHETVRRLLVAHEDVGLTESKDSVVSIGGLKADLTPAPGEDEMTWAVNVNGIESDESSSEYRLHPGDVVQWDLRYWYVTLDVRATVGAFPETFTRGVFGKRFPVTVECSTPSSDACRRVRGALRDAGVDPDGARPPGKLPPRGQVQRAKVLVGPWREWRGRPWPHRIDAGPRYSGIFARFSPGAGELRLQDWYAHPARSLGAGSGLVGAMRPTEEDLLWVVTGVDELGVERASKALNGRDLRDAFAVAVTGEGVTKLPLEPR
jgi:hypothetical protein